jgi:hypothetical protein
VKGVDPQLSRAIDEGMKRISAHAKLIGAAIEPKHRDLDPDVSRCDP